MLLITQGDAAAARRYAPLVTWITPLLAILSLGFFVRARPEAKAHRASRIGLVLDLVALLLWALVVYSSTRTA